MKKLNDYKKKLTKSEIQVLNFCNNNIDKLQTMNIAYVSKKSKVAKTTVFRMAKKLGFSGWKDFKEFAISQKKGQTTEYKKFISKYLNKIQLLADMDNDKEFKKLVKIIEKSQTIVFIGVSRNYDIANLVAMNFLVKGYNSYSFRPHRIENNKLRKLNHNDLVIVISYGGETNSLNQCVKLINTKTKLASITSGNHNWLYKRSDINLIVPHLTEDLKFEPITPKIMFLILLNILTNKVKNK